MGFDYLRSRATADRMILKWGMKAVLRRSSGDRWCWVVVERYMPQEQDGKLVTPTDRKVLMSTQGLTIPPEEGKDALVTFVQPMDPLHPVLDETLRIVSSPFRLAPAGTTILWQLQVRR